MVVDTKTRRDIIKGLTAGFIAVLGGKLLLPENARAANGDPLLAGVASHDQLTGVTSDQHHAQLHKASHDWDGSDRIKLRDLILTIEKLGLLIENDSGFTITKTGSGDVWESKLNPQPLTGATINSTAGWVSWWSIWHDYAVLANRWKWSCRFDIVEGTDLEEAWIGFLPATATFPTITSNHYGFRLISVANGVNADLYASNGNGVNGTQTKIVTGIGPGTTFYVMASYEAADIKFYYSADNITWTLMATHTTNRPTGVSLNFGAWVTNTEAVNKRINIWFVRIFEGD